MRYEVSNSFSTFRVTIGAAWVCLLGCFGLVGTLHSTTIALAQTSGCVTCVNGICQDEGPSEGGPETESETAIYFWRPAPGTNPVVYELVEVRGRSRMVAIKMCNGIVVITDLYTSYTAKPAKNPSTGNYITWQPGNPLPADLPQTENPPEPGSAPATIDPRDFWRNCHTTTLGLNPPPATMPPAAPSTMNPLPAPAPPGAVVPAGPSTGGDSFWVGREMGNVIDQSGCYVPCFGPMPCLPGSVLVYWLTELDGEGKPMKGKSVAAHSAKLKANGKYVSKDGRAPVNNDESKSELDSKYGDQGGIVVVKGKKYQVSQITYSIDC